MQLLVSMKMMKMFFFGWRFTSTNINDNAIKHAYKELATLCAIDIYDITTIFNVVAKGWSGEIYDWMKESMMANHQVVLTKSQWLAFWIYCRHAKGDHKNLLYYRYRGYRENLSI